MNNIAKLYLAILKAKVTRKPKLFIQKLQQQLDKATNNLNKGKGK